jgi:hypothetical protein
MPLGRGKANINMYLLRPVVDVRIISLLPDIEAHCGSGNAPVNAGRELAP